MSKAAAPIRIRMPDGSVRDVPAGTTPLDLARSLGPAVARDAVVARVNGELVDLGRPVQADASIEIVRAGDPDS